MAERLKIDIEYEKARNELIPEAEKVAYQVAGLKPENCSDPVREAWCAHWNRVFHSTMNILAVKAGLIRGAV